MNKRLRRLWSVSLVVLSVVAFGCTESRPTPQQVTASLDRIDTLIATKEWEAARSELRRILEQKISRLSGSAFRDAQDRLNAQAQLVTAGMVEKAGPRWKKLTFASGIFWPYSTATTFG